MSIRQDLDERGRLVRTIERSGFEFLVVEETYPWIGIHLQPPQTRTVLGNTSPRNLPSWTIGWPEGYKGFQVFPQPGFRVESPGAGILEFLSSPAERREGERVTGWTARVQKVDVLYPFDGILINQGQDLGEGENIRLGLWGETEDQERPSRYEDYQGIVPADTSLSTNQLIHIGERIFRVTTTKKNFDGGYTEVTLRAQSNG